MRGRVEWRGAEGRVAKGPPSWPHRGASEQTLMACGLPSGQGMALAGFSGAPPPRGTCCTVKEHSVFLGWQRAHSLPASPDCTPRALAASSRATLELLPRAQARAFCSHRAALPAALYPSCSAGRQRCCPERCGEPSHEAQEGGRCLGGEGGPALGIGGDLWGPSRDLEPEHPFVCQETNLPFKKNIHVAKIPGEKDAVDMLLARNSPSSMGHELCPGRAWTWLLVWMGFSPTHSPLFAGRQLCSEE